MTLKTFTIALAAAAITATSASANTFFAANQYVDASDTLEIGEVSASGAGIVEIYDFRTGTQGALLGTKTVNAGLNTNVRINVGVEPQGDVLAVLKVNGVVANTTEFDILK